MAMITGFGIDEAADMELADGGRFGDSLFGRQVIEAARELLQQQNSEPADPLPLCHYLSARRIWGRGGSGSSWMVMRTCPLR